MLIDKVRKFIISNYYHALLLTEKQRTYNARMACDRSNQRHEETDAHSSRF